MSDLFGAWSLCGQPIERVLNKEKRDAILGSLAEAGKISSVLHGPLWLVADPNHIKSQNGRVLAHCGYIASNSRFPSKLFFADQPALEEFCAGEGHYALILANKSPSRLWLFRDFMGGERLYFVQAGDLVFFANSFKPLLACPMIPQKLDMEVAQEFVVSGNAAVVFGNRTLWAGVTEVLPGQLVCFSTDGPRFQRRLNPLLEKPQEDGGSPSDKLRDRLLSATQASIGSEKEVAVFLSSGIDSSAIAVLAADVLGPKNVHAFTYEFEEPTHGSESSAARDLARRLGISHDVVKISFEDYWQFIPELIWRLESPRIRGGAVLLTARKIAQMGLRKALTGYGAEHLLGLYQHDLAMDYLHRLSQSHDLEFMLEAEMSKCFQSSSSLALMNASRTETERIPSELYYLFLCLLRHNGKIEDPSRYYPQDLRPIFRDLSESSRVREAIDTLRALPFLDQIRHCVFDYFTYLRQIRGRLKACQEMGAQMISPPLFASCIHDSSHFAWHTHRQEGAFHCKRLLIDAMRDRLPDAILLQPKDSEQAPTPKEWQKRILERWRPAAEQAYALMPAFANARNSLSTHYFGALSMLGLFHKMFFELPQKRVPPTWQELNVEDIQTAARPS